MIGALDGVPIRVADLGPELASAESRMLREYCSAVHAVRSQVFESLVEKRLLAAEARKSGLDWEAFLEKQSQKIDETTYPDSVLRAYYDEHKADAAPPFAEIRAEVLAAYRHKRLTDEVTALVTRLRAKAVVADSLPDVRPPPVNIELPTYSPGWGDPQSPVTVVEFGDFECPYCARANDSVKQLRERYGDKIHFVYRHFPLDFHENAALAAEYAQCAGAQGKYWAVHDAFYQHAADGLGPAALEKHALAAGVDAAALKECLRRGDGKRQVASDLKSAETIGVDATPTFYVNGRSVRDSSIEGLSTAVDRALAGERSPAIGFRLH